MVQLWRSSKNKWVNRQVGCLTRRWSAISRQPSKQHLMRVLRWAKFVELYLIWTVVEAMSEKLRGRVRAKTNSFLAREDRVWRWQEVEWVCGECGGRRSGCVGRRVRPKLNTLSGHDHRRGLKVNTFCASFRKWLAFRVLDLEERDMSDASMWPPVTGFLSVEVLKRRPTWLGLR